MKQFTFSLNISYQQYYNYYSGAASNVLIKADSGQSIQLPAYRLRALLTHGGIVGKFCLSLDDNNNFVSIKRC